MCMAWCWWVCPPPWTFVSFCLISFGSQVWWLFCLFFGLCWHLTLALSLVISLLLLLPFLLLASCGTSQRILVLIHLSPRFFPCLCLSLGGLLVTSNSIPTTSDAIRLYPKGPKVKPQPGVHREQELAGSGIAQRNLEKTTCWAIPVFISFPPALPPTLDFLSRVEAQLRDHWLIVAL